MDIQILIAARDPATGEVFRVTVEDLGAHCTVVGSLTDLYHEMSRRPYHGLLLDMPVTVRATEAEKALVHDLLGRVPVLRVLWDVKHREVRSMLYDSNRPLPLADFIREYCHPEAPVTVRRELRLPLHLNVLVAPDPERLSKSPERSVTLNVSEGGCFILSSRDWSSCDTLWIEPTDLSDPSPVELEICWRIPWGLSLRLPGVGGRFTTISEAQKEQILGMLHRRPWIGRV